MKYVIFLSDGAADLPVPELDGRTPLMCADKPNMDKIAQTGYAGMIRTVPEGVPPGSDTANMAVLGYDPKVYYTGRSPIEAVSMGIDLLPDDIAFRVNLVTLSGPDQGLAGRTMVDYSSDEIPSEEAAQLIEILNEHLATDDIRFYPGKSYRHCMVWSDGIQAMNTTPPHDILTQSVDAYLPTGKGGDALRTLMEKSVELFADHPVNRARRERGDRPASAIWIWGQGTRPAFPPLTETYGIKGSVISAVDLVNGLGICAGLRVVDVPGITGNIHTDFAAKGQATIRELASGQDLVYVHVEAPDESGHRAETDNKVLSLEKIDKEIIGPVWAYLEQMRKETGEDYRLLSLPDHATPLSLRTHTADPVPFALYDSSADAASADAEKYHAAAYDEDSCAATGLSVDPGFSLFSQFIEGFRP